MAQGRKILHAAIVAVLLIGGLAVVGTLRRSYIAETAHGTLERKVSGALGADVRIGRLGGPIVSGIVLENVTVRTEGGTEIRLARVEARYSPWELVRAPRMLRELRVERPRVRIVRGEGEGERAGTRFPALPVGAERVVIEGGEIEDRAFTADGLALEGSLRPEGGSAHLAIDSLRAAIALPSRRPIPLRAEGTAVLGPAEACSLRIAIEAAGSLVRLAGDFALLSPVRGEGEVAFSPLDAGELLRSLGAADEVEESRWEGSLRFDGTPGALAFELQASGALRGLPIENLRARGRLQERRIELASLRAETNGAAIEGEGFLDLANGGESRIALSFTHIDPARFVDALAERPPSDLNGSLLWTGSGQDLGSLKGRIALRLGESLAAGARVREASVAGNVVKGGVSIDESVVRMTAAEIRFGGFAGFDGALEGRVDASIPSLGEFRAWSGLDSLAGSARASVRVGGSAARIRAEGSLEVADGAVGPLGFRDLVLDGWVSNQSGKLEGRFAAIVREGSVGDRAFDSTTATVRIEEATLRLEEMIASRGTWEIRTSGLLAREGTSELLLLEETALLHEDTVLVEPERLAVRRERGSIVLEPVRFAFGGGFVSARATRDEKGAIDAELRVEHAACGRLAGFLPVPAELLASLDLEAAYSTSDDAREASLRFRSRPPGTPDFPFVEVEGAARLLGADVFIDSALARGLGGESTLRAEGVIRGLGGGEESLSLAFRAGGLPMRDLRFLSEGLDDLEGNLDAEIRIEGAIRRPTIDAVLSAEGMSFRGYPLGAVFADSARLDEDGLSFSLRFDSNRGEANRARGRIPLRVSFHPASVVFPENEPIEIELRVPRGDLRSLALLAGRGDEAIGEFSLDGRFSGTRANPKLDGVFEIRDGLIFPAGMSLSLDRVNARCLLDEGFLTITSFEARSGDRGRLNAWGTIDLVGFLPAAYEVRFHASEYDVVLADEVEMTFDGDLLLVPDPAILKRPVPHVSGEISVRGALIGTEFGSEAEGAPSILDATDDPEWTCDVVLHVPRNLWIRNNLVDIELEGEAAVRRSDQGLGALGRFEILRGSYYIYPNEFRIETGEISLANPDDLREATIDITARTEVMGEKIRIRAYGTAEDLRVEPTSESGYTEGEILAMLALRARPEEEVRSGDVLSSWARTLAGRVSREMTRGLGDIGTIEIGTSEELPELRYGNYVSSDLYVGFSQKIDTGFYRPEKERSPTREYLAIPDREVRVEYRVRRSLLVEGEVGTLRNGNRFLNLDLKVRVPY